MQVSRELLRTSAAAYQASQIHSLTIAQDNLRGFGDAAACTPT